MGSSSSKKNSTPSDTSFTPVLLKPPALASPKPQAPAPPKPQAPAPPKPQAPAPLNPPAPAPLKLPAISNQDVIIANSVPQHDANNYIIPKIDLTKVEQRAFTLDFRTKVDRFYMKVCPKFQSRKGCNAELCYRFHICSYWIRDNCMRNNCPFDHHFSAQHNQSLLTHLRTRNFNENEVKENLKRYLFAGKSIRENLVYICKDYIIKKCNKSNCEGMHINSPYLWEIYFDGKWIRIPPSLNDDIEDMFRDPQNVHAEINPVHRNKNLIHQLFGNHNIRIDFESMSLTCNNKFYRIKRLSTPSDVATFSSVATRWLWYWEDDKGNWHFYTNAVINNFTVIPFSDYIETQFLRKKMEFVFSMPNTHQYNYTISLENMTQINQTTMRKRKIMRRPMSFLSTTWKDNTTFTSLWNNAISTNKFQRQLVSSSSCEFHFVRQMVTTTLSTFEIFIERIENQHLWQAYQLKKSQMLKSFVGKTALLNEQYLFHGTSESVLDKICSENLDWRLYGTNIGNVFGQGTYFAKNALLSDGYAQKNEKGYKYMFVVLVLVGTAAVGNSSMILPPIDPSTKKRFDTTVNSKNPTIFVKYNLDDYYPAYLIKYNA